MINVLYGLGMGGGIGYLMTHQIISFAVGALAISLAILLEDYGN